MRAALAITVLAACGRSATVAPSTGPTSQLAAVAQLLVSTDAITRTLAAIDQPPDVARPAQLVVVGDTVYLTSEYPSDDTIDGIVAVPLNGGAPRLAMSPTDLHELVPAAGALFWIDEDGLERVRAPGAPPELAIADEGFGHGLVLGPDGLYGDVDDDLVRIGFDDSAFTIAALADGADPLALDGDDVVFRDRRGIWRVPRTGGTPSLVAALDEPILEQTSLVVADGQLYTDAGFHRIVRVDDGAVTDVVHSKEPIAAFTIADGFVYWLGVKAVERTPVGGGEPQIVAWYTSDHGFAEPASIVVAGDRVLWPEWDGVFETPVP